MGNILGLWGRSAKISQVGLIHAKEMGKGGKVCLGDLTTPMVDRDPMFLAASYGPRIRRITHLERERKGS